MEKQILTLLLILSPAFAHSMENNSFFPISFALHSYLSALFPSNQTPQESKLITDLRASKNEFEDRLQLIQWGEPLKYPLITLFGTYRVDSTPFKFLQYCYYHKTQNDIFIDLRQIGASHALQKYQDAQLDGYSALGATIISINTSNQEKFYFTEEFINRGFKPTPKDIDLAKLALYDEIIKHKTLIHILYSQADWSVLPPEVIKIITHNMMQLLVKELWLLPGTIFFNGFAS